MGSEQNKSGLTDVNLGFAFSAIWWNNSFKLVHSLLPKFLLPAFLVALSNLASLYSDSLLSGGLNLADVSPQALEKMLTTLLTLGVIGSIGLILGLVALSIWMYLLTALAKLSLLLPTDGQINVQNDLKSEFAANLKKIKAQSKHISATWMIGFLYLLLPVCPLSGLMALCILANSPVLKLEAPLLSLPSDWVFPIYFCIAFLSAVTINYSLVLTVLSSNVQIKPKQSAFLAFDIIGKHFLPLLLVDLVLFFLDVVISAPYLIMPGIPQLKWISHNFAAQFIMQIWFAISSAYTWPLSLLIFSQLLKPMMGGLESDQIAKEIG